MTGDNTTADARISAECVFRGGAELLRFASYAIGRRSGDIINFFFFAAVIKNPLFYRHKKNVSMSVILKALPRNWRDVNNRKKLFFSFAR